MASFTAGTTFVDGVSNDVTAAKLSALVNNATPTSGFIQDRTAESITATNDTLLIGDASDSNNLKRITVANFAQTLPTAKVTTGTIDTGTFGTTTSTAATITTGTITNLNSTTGTVATLNSTTGTITTGVIPTLTSITKITSGTGTAAAPAISPTGDTNTGIFFPAADTVAFAEGGTEAMRIDSSGNVGIGTTSPSAKLNVYDASSATIFLQGDSTTQAFMQRASADATSPQIDLRKSRGSIASPAAVNTGDFLGFINFQAFGGTNNRILSRIYGQAETYVSDTNISSNLVFQTSAAGGVLADEKMRITGAGNVGVGTTSPATKLHIATSGASSIDETLRLENSSNTSSNGNKITWRNAGQTTECAFISGLREGAATSFALAIGTSPNFTSGGTNAVERLRIDSSGNVGIGVTSPSSKLDVDGTVTLRANSTEGGQIQLLNPDNSTIGLTMDVSTGSNVGRIISASTNSTLALGQLVGTGGIITAHTAAAERMRIDASGNVSIGTATALSRLHVHGDLTMSNATVSTTAATGGLTLPATAAGYLTVSINGTSRKIPYYA
jgi:hypothetical protein